MPMAVAVAMVTPLQTRSPDWLGEHNAKCRLLATGDVWSAVTFISSLQCEVLSRARECHVISDNSG